MAENIKPAGKQASPTTAAAPAKPILGKAPTGKTLLGKAPAAKGTPASIAKAAKPKKKISGALVVGLLFVLLIAAGLGMMYFDLYGLRDFAVSAFELVVLFNV